MKAKAAIIVVAIVTTAVAAILILEIWKVNHYQSAYNALKQGATKTEVISDWGPAKDSKSCRSGGTWDDKPIPPGTKDCVEELWYFSRVTPEQWAIGFDEDGRAVSKYHFVSP